jgi:sirohydrochlorin ferrochelatase
VSLTRPTVGEAVDRCVRLGAERIAVVPYFLNTGVLLKRIDDQLAEIQQAGMPVPIARGSHLGLHPRLLDLLERRAREGLDRDAQNEGLMAVCGRPSCASVAGERAALLRPRAGVG